MNSCIYTKTVKKSYIGPRGEVYYTCKLFSRLAAMLNKLPNLFNPSFRNYYTKVINGHYNEFDNDKYIMYFFLNPCFRSAVLKKLSFKRITKCVVSMGQRLGFDFYEIDILLDQLQQYKDINNPFDLNFSFTKKSPLKW